jgi:cell fate (sporulation/competence/biofilm development) regulator YlbF (YheA/YmcA/DUF963 family)
MDIIEQARALGKALQQEDSYLRMQIAVQNADADKELQDMIGQYNLKRMSIQNEMQNGEKDENKLREYQQEMNGLYEMIMKNPHMAVYNEAKNDFSAIFRRVNAILEQSANGGDPETADYEESSCSGDCCSCGGCH